MAPRGHLGEAPHERRILRRECLDATLEVEGRELFVEGPAIVANRFRGLCEQMCEVGDLVVVAARGGGAAAALTEGE